MTWIPGKGWDAPLEPPNMRHQIICPVGSRWVPLDYWDGRNKVSIDHRRTEQARIERPAFGQRRKRA